MRITPLFLFCGMVFFAVAAQAQDTINPFKIQQPNTIVLHHTDVYYRPFAPPSAMDTREYLSDRGDIYRDSDGLGSLWGDYLPQVWDSSRYVALKDWSPSGIPIGPYTPWQRLFHARNKPDGSHSDIVAGGATHDTVTISKNEDVDFRATGTVKMENGFHVKPGAFFHAYQEPRWDTTVFADEFDDTAKFHNQWRIYNGIGTDLHTDQCDKVNLL